MNRDLSRLMPSKAEQQAAFNIKVSTENIAEAMQALHGGEWKVRVDHETQIVSIRRKWPLNRQ